MLLTKPLLTQKGAAAAAALTFTFACYVDKDKHIGDISIVDGLAWADMCAKLCELAGSFYFFINEFFLKMKKTEP
jgi:hypothetical protein